jgi:hypothetical protein
VELTRDQRCVSDLRTRLADRQLQLFGDQQIHRPRRPLRVSDVARRKRTADVGLQP